MHQRMWVSRSATHGLLEAIVDDNTTWCLHVVAVTTSARHMLCGGKLKWFHDTGSTAFKANVGGRAPCYKELFTCPALSAAEAKRAWTTWCVLSSRIKRRHKHETRCVTKGTNRLHLPAVCWYPSQEHWHCLRQIHCVNEGFSSPTVQQTRFSWLKTKFTQGVTVRI